ncbi:cilia- and flagella-associated protein 57-like [Clytia hemisphaerica]|uniref:EML-like second beta-propeller domain-containing protein n=1 Tax=Clytia hemisphaerica TaxID=252671 RepID=A0A7M5TYH9_9CNID
MSIALASPRHVFGFKSNVANNLWYLDEQTIVYPSGSNCILYNIDQRTQKFIPCTENGNGITAIAVSPNRRYVAIAEKADKPTITIYDLHSLRKRKVLSTPECQSLEFVSISFSPDSKYLIAQGGRPDWTLFYWTWEKAKVLASTKSSNQQNSAIYQVTFNPNDNTHVCVTGHGIFKLFRYSENNLKQFAFQKADLHRHYLCQSWLNEEKLLVGTDSGKVLLFEGGELKGDFPVIENTLEKSGSNGGLSANASVNSLADLTSNKTVQPATSVPFIAAYSKGFVCSGGLGAIYVYEKTEEKEMFKKIKEIRIPIDQQSADPSLTCNQQITCIALSPSEETVVCSTNSNQLYTIPLSSADIGKQGEIAEFEMLAQSFHHGQITGLDVCIRKPLMATCGMDRSIRIWNFDSCTLELYKVFQEEAYSIALHPSGLYVLVGFSDKLRLMNLLIDDIRPFKEFTIRGCRECCFSNGGHLFAAVHGNVIQLYSTSTFENIGNLKGHNGKVRCIRWNADDSKLISCGMDGAIYEWNMFTYKRDGESILKSCSYSCVSVSPDSRTMYAVGSDRSIKEICDGQILRDVPSDDCVLTQVALSRSGRMLFAGTNNGTVRSFKFPLSVPGEWQEHQTHAGAISKMRISYDDQYLITVSEDCCLFVYKISDKEGRGKRDRDVPYAEEVLITKSDLEEKNTVMSELKTRVEELKMENEYQLRLKDMNYNEKIKELTEKFIQEMESLKTKNQMLKTDKDKEAAKHEEEVSEQGETHIKELEDIESANNKKLMSEYEKYQELQTKSQRMQEDYERQLQQMEEAREHALEELTEYYEKKLQDKTSTLEQANEESRQHLREYEETKKQIEEDADREILDIKNKYERKLREEKEANLRLKGETGIMRRKFTSLQKEIEDHKAEIQRLHGEESKLQGIIKSLEKDIYGLKKEIQERDETIQDKEKRIYDLKKKNQELEKFKFVLDYKIKELKKQIEPRENDIKEMKEQIQEMESELERFHKQNTGLELNIAELRLKLKATEKELYGERQTVHDKQALVKRFKTDLHNAAGFIQEPKKLKEHVKELYGKYVSDDTPEEASVDLDIQKEYARQREHLERSVASLRKKLAKDTEIHRADNVRIMQENVYLIKEINDLRRELKNARTQVHDLEASINVMRKHQNAGGMSTTSLLERRDSSDEGNKTTELNKMIDLQKTEMRRLRAQIVDMESKIAERPSSGGGRLPPLPVQ